MARENTYTIEIRFEVKPPTKTMYRGQVPYFGSTSFSDEFEICNDKIIIIAKRSAIIPLDNIFQNHFSSLYNQLLKSILFYYASTRKFAKILSIEITRVKSRKKMDQNFFNGPQFKQVLDDSFLFRYKIIPNRLEKLFEESPAGRTTLIAISYLLVSNTSISESDKFEKLWKAFNMLYTQIGNGKKDFDCLRNLRDFITRNPSILPLSSNKVKSLTVEKLRNTIRWRAMLLDNYDTEAKTKSFKEFVLRYSDKRIMQIILDTKYGYREDFLRKHSWLLPVDTHIHNNISAGTVIDNEIVLFLTGKYMYFVRNKTFHGEKVDSAFRLTENKEDRELKFLNSVLEPYLVDLINANNLY